MRFLNFIVLGILLGSLSAAAPAQDPTPACTAPEHRAFDFQVEERNVRRADGQKTGLDRKIARHRISWTPSADGSVQQLWESRGPTDEWALVFDGKYTRR